MKREKKSTKLDYLMDGWWCVCPLMLSCPLLWSMCFLSLSLSPALLRISNFHSISTAFVLVYFVCVVSCLVVIQIIIRLFQSYWHGLMPVFFFIVAADKMILRRATEKKDKKTDQRIASYCYDDVETCFFFFHRICTTASSVVLFFFGRCLINGKLAPAYD